MTRTPILFALALTLGGCDPVGVVGGSVGEAPAVTGSGKSNGYSASPYIVNGQSDTGHPSAGKLMSNGSGCTATLIGKRTVLTAGHCINGTAQFTIGGQTYSSAKTVVHPSYGGGNQNDVAIIILGQDVVGVAPAPIMVSAPQVGQSIVLVGYGKTGEYNDDFGSKRMGSNTIARVGSTTFSFDGGSNVCNGDSGGPTYILVGSQEVVAGVHSTKSGVCGSGGTDMRVDAYQSWIKTTANGDVVTPDANPNPGPQPDPNPNPNPAPGPSPQPSGASEGQSCSSTPCAAGLACAGVYYPGYTVPWGKFCFVRCTSLGSVESPCNGGELCTLSKDVGAPICFNPNSPQTGFTSNGGGTPSQPTPPAPSTGACGGPEESQVFELLNKVRAQYGLGALACDATGSKAARAHSQDMCTRGFFSHTNPEGQQPWDRLQGAGASFGAAGENIAMGYGSAAQVHQGWMNSSGHRQNMLSPQWSRVGIGYVACGGEPYWTEVFMD